MAGLHARAARNPDTHSPAQTLKRSARAAGAHGSALCAQGLAGVPCLPPIALTRMTADWSCSPTTQRMRKPLELTPMRSVKPNPCQSARTMFSSLCAPHGD